MSGQIPDDVDLSDAEFRDIMVPRLDEVSKDNYLGEANYNKLFPVRKELLSCTASSRTILAH